MAAVATGQTNDDVAFILRHSERLDDDKDATWPDKDRLPHDTPIADHELPKEAARQILAKLGSFSQPPSIRIVCSPFRRCLQTAKDFSDALPTGRVTFTVHHGLSEVASRARQAYTAAGKPVPEGVIPLMSEHEMGKILGPKFQGVQGRPVNLRESPQDSMQRFTETVRQITSQANEVTIIVTHGDCLNAVCNDRGKTAFEVPECSWVAIDLTSDMLVGKSDALLWMDDESYVSEAAAAAPAHIFDAAAVAAAPTFAAAAPAPADGLMGDLLSENERLKRRITLAKELLEQCTTEFLQEIARLSRQSVNDLAHLVPEAPAFAAAPGEQFEDPMERLLSENQMLEQRAKIAEDHFEETKKVLQEWIAAYRALQQQ